MGATQEGVKNAEAASGSDFGGRNIFIEKTKPKEQRDFGANKRNFESNNNNNEGGFERKRHSNEECTAFVGNLSFNTDEDKLWEFFEPCGNLKDVRIGKNHEGQSRGFAFV